jgi:hypothetical protein
MATSSRPLQVAIGPGLAFRFSLPAPLLRRIETFLGFFLDGDKDPEDETRPLEIAAEAMEEVRDGMEVVVREPPLVVRRGGSVVSFELPCIQAWCDGERGLGGVVLDRPSDRQLELFVSLALAPLLIELASARGWFGIHAAGVAIEGTGFLLPGPSGAGKSTIVADAHGAGLGVLSDDLLWLRPGPDGATMFPFPRGTYGGAVPMPNVSSAPVGAIVCPVVAGDASGRLVSLSASEALEILVAEGGFLGAGPAAGKRFAALVDVAGAVPAYRLEAGPRSQTPGLLTQLARSLSHSDPAMHQP